MCVYFRDTCQCLASNVKFSVNDFRKEGRKNPCVRHSNCDKIFHGRKMHHINDHEMNAFTKSCDRIIPSEHSQRINRTPSTTNSIMPRHKAPSSASFANTAPCGNGGACPIFPITSVCGRKRQEGNHPFVDPKRQRQVCNEIAQDKESTTKKIPCSALPDGTFYDANNREMNAIGYSSISPLPGTKSCGKKSILHRTEKAENIQTLKHPRTAYNFFVQSEHSKISNDLELQEASKSSNFQKTGKILGQKWKKMNSSEKQKFEDLAKLDITRYQMEVKEYYAKSLHLMKTQKQAIEQQSSCNSLCATKESSERLNGLKTGSFMGFPTHYNAGCDQLLLLSAMPPFYYGFACHDNPLNVLPMHGVGQYIPVQDKFKRPKINHLSELSPAGSPISSYTDMGGMQLLDYSSKVLPMSQFLHVPFGQYCDAASNTLFGQHSQTLIKVNNGLNSTAFADSTGRQLSDHSNKVLPAGPSLHVPFGLHRDAINDAFGQHAHTLSSLKNDSNSNDLGVIQKSMFSPK